jgi:hypothetical protein
MPHVLYSPKLDDLNLNNKCLLINAPAVDTRVPWAAWQQPQALLQIGTSLKAQGCDVRLIDSLQTTGSRLPREKVGELKIDGYKINFWQFGLSPKKIGQILRSWIKNNWVPDNILISCGLSCWWKGAAEVIHELKNITTARIILGGQYPSSYPEHAASNSNADLVVAGFLKDFHYLPTDFNIYHPLTKPKFSAIQAFTFSEPNGISPRQADEVVNEIRQKCKLGISSFIWYDEEFLPDQKEGFTKILDLFISADLKVAESRSRPKLIAPGNLSPRLIDNDLAVLLKKAKFSFISLHDDLLHSPNNKNYLSSYDNYRDAIDCLKNAGFPLRNGTIDASIVVGIPGEDVIEATKRMVILSSIVGSIHLVPFQYSPTSKDGIIYTDWLAKHDGHLDLTNLNGKLFPLVRVSGANTENYWELTRLMALLNSKFHSSTPDFLGNSFTAKMVRNSLRSNLWDPFTKIVKEVEKVQQ